eukprot:gnl/TRDRNA2_/TRDRNA2_184712_c0_seq1.p1 gnl/TRDRNA2_/TRDRNA2_184712_c0~~gnl/TRDRNA2_/TRDRNA2_184712_c0_seq1.p1  ORF type:complete len:261 (-),score=65.04 gnl/TRDRNA2_/TRDRNA2_184712_c0_seq1:27-809(-)
MQCSSERRWPIMRLLCLVFGFSGCSAHLLLKQREQLQRQVPPPPPFPLPMPKQPVNIVEASPFNDETGYPDDDSSADADISKPQIQMVQPQHMDEIATATTQIEQELESQAEVGANAPQVTRKICAEAAKKTKALSCSITSYMTGNIDGCECQLIGKKCPPPDKGLGFTGVSPSIPISVPQMEGLTAILCMYWQWLPPTDKSAQVAKAAAASKAAANMYIDAAHIYAGGVSGDADKIWALTVPPFPLPPEGAAAPGPAPA